MNLKSQVLSRPLRRSFLLGALLLLAVFLAACGSTEESWAGLVRYQAEGEDILLVSYRGHVMRFDTNGERRWAYEGEGDTDFFAPVTIDEDRLYVGDYKGRIHAVRLSDGRNIWTYEEKRTRILFINLGSTERVIAPIELGGEDRLFFGNESGVHALTGIDGDDPKIEWSFEDVDHSVWAQPLYISDVEGLETIDEPVLYAASLDKQLYALNPETGKKLWSLDLKGAIVNQPTFDRERERLYVSTLDYEVYAISLDGKVIDRYETNGWVWGRPALYRYDGEDRLYFNDLAGWMYELTLTNEGFEETWKAEVTEDGAALRATPTIIEAEGTPFLLVGSEDQHVYAIDLDEKSIKWRREMEDKVFSRVVVVNNVTRADDQENEETAEPLVIVSTDDSGHLLVALNLVDGKERWSYEYDE